MKKSLVKEDLKNSTTRLFEVLSEIPGDDFNKKPGREEWSVGKVAEHLIKAETGTLRLFSGSSKVSEREPKKNIQLIRERMMDVETKMEAFGPILPDDDPKDKPKVLEKLQDIRQRSASLIGVHDLTETLTGFEHPVFGWLTRIEWIYFNIYHSQRHLKQIEKIRWQLH